MPSQHPEPMTRQAPIVTRKAATAMLAAILATTPALTTMTATCPTEASAEPSATTAEGAREEWARLRSDAEQAEYDLIDANKRLSEARDRVAEIDARTGEVAARLDEAQARLASLLADGYKANQMTTLDAVMGASSWEDLLDRMEYVNKVTDRERAALDEVRGTEAALAEERERLVAEQEELSASMSEKEARLAEANAAADAAREYYSSLPLEVRAAIAEDDLKERQEATDLAARYESPAMAGASDEAATLVDRAFSIIGSAYSWSGYSWSGSPSGSAFTCSGVVDYALGRGSHSSSPETLYAEVGSNMVYDTSQLNYGDVVFYAFGGRYPTGHTGIYIGDGLIIDSIPNGGVQIRDVSYMTFVGGGPIV